MDVNTIAERLLFTTVRLETQYPTGNVGLGTSFFFDYLFDDNHAPFLVTVKHVVKGTSKGKIIFICGNEEGIPMLGNCFGFNISRFETIWYMHSDPEIDIAIVKFLPMLDQIIKSGQKIFFNQAYESF